jgi:hypothetical protein
MFAYAVCVCMCMKQRCVDHGGFAELSVSSEEEEKCLRVVCICCVFVFVYVWEHGNMFACCVYAVCLCMKQKCVGLWRCL